MACSVTASQPLPRCEPGLPGATVRTRLRSRTPCCVQGVRSPLAGCGRPRSSRYSWRMLRRLPGSGLTSGATLKLRPTGWPGVGYGSWPTIRTRTSSSGCWRAARMRVAFGRNGRFAARSARRKSPSWAITSATGASASAQPGPTLSASERVAASAVLTPAIVGGLRPRGQPARAGRRRARRTTIRGGALVAQGIEQRFPKPCVGGSSPPGGIANQQSGFQPPRPRSR